MILSRIKKKGGGHVREKISEDIHGAACLDRSSIAVFYK